MAVDNVTFKVNLRQNKNENSHAYLKYYVEPDTTEPLNLKGFAKHIADHGKIATFDLIQLVLNNVVSCMTELLKQGQPVKLDGLGTFTPTIENAPSVNGTPKRSTVEQCMESGMSNLIAGVHINFLPENSKGEQLTSRAFKEACVFEAAYLIESKKKTIDGKVYTYQEKIPLSSYAVAKAQADGEGSGD